MKKLILSLLMISAVSLVSAQSANKSKKLPNVAVKSLDGKTVMTGAFENDGKPIIVNFWATWCSPCKRELKNIQDVYEDWQDETGVKLIAISIDDARNKHKVRPYVNTQGWEYEVYIDENRDFFRALSYINPPQTALLMPDANGVYRIVYEHNGYSEGDEDELFEVLEKHLK